MHPCSLLALVPLLGGCVLPGPPESPRSDAAAVPRLAVDHATLGVDYVLPGAWVEHAGTSHLWVAAFGGAVDRPTIMHMQAAGSRPWGADADPVVMDHVALGLNEIGPIPSSVLVEENGTWAMYGGGRLPGDRPIIWRATAPGPDGPWSFRTEPVLEPATDGWDSAIVDHPSVVATDDGYLMLYGGASRTERNRNRIGVARSEDGIDWERVAATLPGADEGDALGPSGCGIDARTMFEPELAMTEDGYRLHFAAMLTGSDDVMVIGVAESHDGLTWRCTVDGPLVEPDEVVAGASLHSYLVPPGDAERILVEVLGTESPSSDLWLIAPQRPSR